MFLRLEQLKLNMENIIIENMFCSTYGVTNSQIVNCEFSQIFRSECVVFVLYAVVLSQFGWLKIRNFGGGICESMR